MKTRLASKYSLETSPRLVDIIAAVPAEHKKALVPKLRAKPVRTASGVSDDATERVFQPFGREIQILCALSCPSSVLNRVETLPRLFKLIQVLLPQIAVVAVMCKPHRCPHINMTGNICVYCPGGPDSDFEYSTQSYTGYEPTSMRAIRAR